MNRLAGTLTSPGTCRASGARSSFHGTSSSAAATWQCGDRYVRRASRPLLPRTLPGRGHRPAGDPRRRRSRPPAEADAEDVLRDPGRFRPDARDARDGVALRSSGTTGESLSLFHDSRSVLLNVAYSERERALESALVGKRPRYTRLYLSHGTVENVERVRGLAARESFRPFRPRYHLESFNRPREELVHSIERRRPDALAGSGSVLEAFFRVTADARATAPAARRDLRLGRDDDGGARADRANIPHPVLSRYSAMECLKIGFFCEQRRGFHLHEDLCHVRPTPGARERRTTPLEPLQPRLRAPQLPDRGPRGAVERAMSMRPQRTPALDLDGRVNEVIELPDGSIVGAIRSRPPSVQAGCPTLPARATCPHGVRPRTVDGRGGRLPTGGGAGCRRAPASRGCEVRPVHRKEIPLAPGRKHRFVVQLDVDQ